MVVGLLIIQSQAYQEVLILDNQKGGVNLLHCPKSRHSILVVNDW